MSVGSRSIRSESHANWCTAGARLPRSASRQAESLAILDRTIVGLVASGRTIPEILAAYPYLEEADIREALAYAAWRLEETEVPLTK